MAIKLDFNGIVQSSAIVAATGVPPISEGSGRHDFTNSQLILDYTATLSGSYTAGGDVLDFTTAPPQDFQLPSVAPSFVQFSELATIGTAATGFQFGYAYGPNLQSPTPQGGAMQIFGGATASQDGLNEIPAGTYASQTPSLNNKQIRVRAYFAKST